MDERKKRICLINRSDKLHSDQTKKTPDDRSDRALDSFLISPDIRYEFRSKFYRSILLFKKSLCSKEKEILYYIKSMKKMTDITFTEFYKYIKDRNEYFYT